MKPKILVVNDEENLRFTFKRVLQEEGYEVLEEEDYVSALDIISSNEPDLIFLDMIMGENTGIDLLREIRSMGFSCPVIMTTPKLGIDTAKESARLGFFDLLEKPVRKDTLISITARALKKSSADKKKRILTGNKRYRINLGSIQALKQYR